MFQREEAITAMKERHSVRSYFDKKIEGDVKEKLLQYIDQCNLESGLHMQLILDEPKAFKNFLCHYGMFSGVKNYIALIGKDTNTLEETCGYYGEKVVLFAQYLGLRTCWVAATYKKVKSAYQIDEGEKLLMVIAIGYGEKQGVPHKDKELEKLCDPASDAPAWFMDGVRAAMLAPTAINQQKFYFSLKDGKVLAKAGSGPYTMTDLGIVKYHFELGAGKEHFEWAD